MFIVIGIEWHFLKLVVIGNIYTEYIYIYRFDTFIVRPIVNTTLNVVLTCMYQVVFKPIVGTDSYR